MRALYDSHIQIGRQAYILRTEVGPSPSELWRTPAGRRPNAIPICWISGWPRAVNAISSAGHLESGRAPAECMFHEKTHIFERALGEVLERYKIAGKACSFLTPTESAARSERFLNFDSGPTGPRMSLQIPRCICRFSYSPRLLLPTLSKCD